MAKIIKNKTKTAKKTSISNKTSSKKSVVKKTSSTKKATVKKATVKKKNIVKKTAVKEFDNSKNKLYISIFLGIIIIISFGIFLSMQNSNNMNQTNMTSSMNQASNSMLNNLNSAEIVAKFNGGQITSTDFNKEIDLIFLLRGIPESYKSKIPKLQILNQSIIQSLVYTKAVSTYGKLDLVAAQNQINNLLSKSNTNLSSFKKSLENKSFSYDDFLNYYAKQLLVTKYINSTISSKINVSNLEISNYYTQNLNKFSQKEKVRASHILVNSSDEAMQIITQLNNGADFATLAKNRSIGPSSVKGGDLGFFSRGAMVPAFNKAVFSLKNISDYTKTPIKTQFGYHIIKLTGKTPAINSSLAKVSTQIKSTLLKEKESTVLKSFIDNLYKSSNVQIFIK